MNAAEDNDIRIGRGGLLRQQEGIPPEIGNFLYLIPLIIMGKDYRVALLLQLKNALFQEPVLLSFMCTGQSFHRIERPPSHVACTGDGDTKA
ncbi:hypothetical protein D3C76_1485430 [compost metagenome]